MARRTSPGATEVQLPPGFDLGRADTEVRQSSAQWAAEGVRTIDGAPLPEFADGAILLPAGARGPAFLVGPNFRAILRYNNSTSYALAVGLLAQRLADGPGVQAPWPRDLHGAHAQPVDGAADGLERARLRRAARPTA